MEVVTCPEDTSSRRRAFYPTAYLFDYRVDEMSGRSDSWLGWSRNLIISDKDLVLGDDKKDRRINLRGRDLRYATLDRSNLRRADFEGAKLGGSHLFQADLKAAKFGAASLQGARLVGASLQGADFSWARLQGADLSGANLQGAHFRGADLQGADLRGANLQGATLYETSLQGADLRLAELQGADLVSASLQGADLSSARLQGANFSNARLQGADLSGADLRGADLRGADLQGIDIDAASLQGADLYSISVWRSRLRTVNEVPVHGDGLDLVSLATWNILWPDDEELADTIAELKKLSQQISKDGLNVYPYDDEHLRGFSDTFRTKEDAKGRALVEVAADRVADRLRPLLGADRDDKWGDDLRAWCKLAQQPRPDSAKLSAYLGRLACDDQTDEAYLAQSLIRRVTVVEPTSPNGSIAFLKMFKGCPTFARIPADLRSQLEFAAQQDRESAANARANPEKVEQPVQPEVPPICVELDKKPAVPAATGSKPTP
jgi:uncharacterized protein YjbI with pentapeptide repeats